MEMLLETVCEYFVPVLIGTCILVAMFLKTLASIFTTASRERSRRELAAYIAEGSVSPEQGERLLRAHVGRTT